MSLGAQDVIFQMFSYLHCGNDIKWIDYFHPKFPFNENVLGFTYSAFRVNLYDSHIYM